MQMKNMNAHELAIKTYRDLQLRRLARKKRAECECESLKVEAVIRANNKRYRLRNR